MVSMIFFVNVGPDLANKIKQEDCDIYSYMKNRNDNSMFLLPCY